MNKLYLLLLLTLLLFIPATHAVTPYRLDQPITELNGFTLRDVFENTSLFDSEQLVTNGDFSDGTTGWDILNASNVVNRLYFNIPMNQNGYAVQTSLYTGDVHYVHLEYEHVEGLGFRVESELNVSSDIFLLTETGVFSKVFTALSDFFRINRNSSAVSSQGYFNNITLFNISTLIANKQYSPLYQNTFDLMSDDEIKSSMDLFVSIPYLFIDYQNFGIDNLTVSQMQMYYNYYLNTFEFEIKGGVSTEFFLISTFFMYILIMGIGYFTKNKYLYFAGAILWFVPIFNYQNIFIITTSIIVFISHLLIIFYSDKDDVFE